MTRDGAKVSLHLRGAIKTQLLKSKEFYQKIGHSNF